jgi:hypothetical protein
VRYECKSCLEGGAVEECPVCHGQIHFRDVCPACDGQGVISRTRRSGIAVFPALRGLYRYLAERDADVRENVIVELEGRLSDDRDLDADAGALLIKPTGLVSVRPFDHALLGSIRSRVSSLRRST